MTATQHQTADQKTAALLRRLSGALRAAGVDFVDTSYGNDEGPSVGVVNDDGERVWQVWACIVEGTRTYDNNDDIVDAGRCDLSLCVGDDHGFVVTEDVDAMVAAVRALIL